MGSFIPSVFDAGAKAAEAAARDKAAGEVEQRRAEDKQKSRQKRRTAQIAGEQEEKRLSDKDDDLSRLRVGTSNLISTSTRGVLGEPITGRRRLSI